MKEKPILFNSEMIKAILAGTKTITRRPVNPQPELIIQAEKHSTYKFKGGLYALDMYTKNSNILNKCPFGQVGDKLWVRETWKPKYVKGGLDGFRIHYPDVHPWFYAADGECEKGYGSWKPSIHMPRCASRLLLEITAVRIECIQNITREDALAEGIQKFMVDCSRDGIKTAYKNYEVDGISRNNPIDSFRTLWKKTYGAESWDNNIWVWVIEFKVGDN